MDIVFLESAQNFGGARMAVIQMATALNVHYNVEIVDFYGSCKPFVDACVNSKLKFLVLNPNCNPHYIRSANSIFTRIRNFITLIPHIIKMNRMIRAKFNNVDYVCVTSFRTLLSLCIKKPKAKIVFFAHGWYIKNQIGWFFRLLLKKCNKIVCISEATRQAIYNIGIAKLSQLLVVHNSIDESSFVRVIPAIIPNSEGCIKILHCGGFTIGKGQHISVEIAKELKKRGVRFKLLLVGIVYQGNESKSYLERIKRMIESNGLTNDIILIVNKYNVYEYIKACDILIHPSESEGLPLVVMEAQLLKKPVVVNSVGGVIDLVLNGYTGFIPSYNNIKEYANIIEQLVKDAVLYSKISENAYALIKGNFNIDSQLVALHKVFNS